MTKAIIYVFSGTGNTLKACELYKQEFEKHNVDTLLYCIKGGFKDIPNPNDFDYVGFAYPVHGFNAPKILLDFAKALPKSSQRGKLYFIVKTSGEPLKINNVSSIKLTSILRKKGYSLMSEYHYVMPYNMIFRHTEAMAYRMMSTVEALAPIEAREVLHKEPHLLKSIPFGRFISWIVRIEQPAMKVNGRFFKVDKKKCIGCGMCERNCPVGNIHIDEKGKFHFGGDCLMCTRCSFNCPTDAFNIALLNGWRVNGKYAFKLPEKDEKNKHEWYCKRAYIRYFDNADKKVADNGEGNDVK